MLIKLFIYNDIKLTINIEWDESIIKAESLITVK